jgi:hypothetical protein
MGTFFRSAVAVLAGILLGGLANMAVLAVGARMVPPPEGVEVNDLESINEHLGEYAPIQFLVPFLAHAFGTLVGGIVATLVAPGRRTVPAYVVAAFFLLGGLSMVLLLPNSPGWFIALDLVVAYVPMAWLASRIVAKRQP